MHHEFSPTHYHTAIGPHEPVLRVKSGDSVSTTTVDSGGRDKTGNQVTEGGNPQTGPFYVEGAKPGDTLAVRWDRLTPNREYGYTSGRIAGNVLDPDYLPKFDAEVSRFIWKIDFENSTASPAEFTFDRNSIRPGEGEPVEGLLANLKLPLNPHSGCFGVAPPRGQAISTATSSTHGGNMDYNGFVQGVTMYLPVFVEGALFHVGDGHALQGDGEIVGTGIEISFDVSFTVEVLSGETIHWPRAESNTHIMAAGNARPLDQCVEHASTEMIRMLERDWGLTTREAHVLMGETVEYDMANMYDPAYTMICKMSKSVLEQMGATRRSSG